MRGLVQRGQAVGIAGLGVAQVHSSGYGRKQSAGCRVPFITRPSRCSDDMPHADELPADIAAEIEEARKALDLEEGVDYEATMKVGWRSGGGSD